MSTCGYIKVQPDGLKQKEARTLQRWDIVSKRIVNIPPPIPTIAPPIPTPPPLILHVTVYGGAAISNPVVIYDGGGANDAERQTLYGGNALGI